MSVFRLSLALAKGVRLWESLKLVLAPFLMRYSTTSSSPATAAYTLDSRVRCQDRKKNPGVGIRGCCSSANEKAQGVKTPISCSCDNSIVAI